MHIKYDAAVPFDSRDLPSILKYQKGHCGHQMTAFEAMCTRAGIPDENRRRTELEHPGRRRGPPPDSTRFRKPAHLGPGLPSRLRLGRNRPRRRGRGVFLPGQLIQNSTDFQNYVIWIREDGNWKIADWEFRRGKWYSRFGIENRRIFRKES